MNETPLSGDKVRAFGEFISGSAINNLKLLRLIDDTIEGLCVLERHVNADADYVFKAKEKLDASKRKKSLDPNNVSHDLIISGEDGLRELYGDISEKKKAAERADELADEHKENVVQAYDRALNGVTRLYDAAQKLRWTIMEHDADLSPKTGEFTNINDLTAHLDKL